MIDECWQAHTQEDTDANFAKPQVQQDPFFGVTGIIKRLMKRANEIRRPARWLALDEEIISLLGKCAASQFCKDKKSSRGPNVFSLVNRCNFRETTVESLIGMTGVVIKKVYYHWVELYRGKSRDQPSPFSIFGKGFDVVCRAMIDMNLRYQGYFLVCDS